jgi:hypothetical protein
MNSQIEVIIEIGIVILVTGIILLIGWLVLQDVKEEYDYAVSYCAYAVNGPVPTNDSLTQFNCVNGTVQGMISVAMD